MNLSRPDRVEALAAQYVLGTLRGRARARFERALRSDRVVGDAVHRWEERLLPLSVGVDPVAPPDRVWRAIQARLPTAHASWASFWSSVSLWRGLSVASMAVVVLLAILLLRAAPERPEGALVAVLAAKDAKATLVASADRSGRYLTIKAIEPIDLPPDRSLQLWMLPASGNPQSLGVFDTTTVARVALSAPAEQSLGNIPALAVSLEPRGGSPTGLPTGPVLYSGSLQRTY